MVGGLHEPTRDQTEEDLTGDWRRMVIKVYPWEAGKVACFKYPIFWINVLRNVSY